MIFGRISSNSPLARPSVDLRLPLPAAPTLLDPGRAPLPLAAPELVDPAMTVSTELMFAVAGFECVEDEDEVLVWAVGRFRSLGAGKLDFLSIASTVRWKRRKRASARMRVDSRSIVVESSLTVHN